MRDVQIVEATESPFTFTAPSRGSLMIANCCTGAPPSADGAAGIQEVTFSRDRAQWFPTGFPFGSVAMSEGDQVRITAMYPARMQLTFVPM